MEWKAQKVNHLLRFTHLYLILLWVGWHLVQQEMNFYTKDIDLGDFLIFWSPFPIGGHQVWIQVDALIKVVKFQKAYSISSHFWKVSKFRKQIVKSRILPKNEGKNSFLLVCNVFLFVFWKNPRPEKQTFRDYLTFSRGW